MLLYVLGRAIAGIALRWFYRDIQVQGVERIPRRGPLLVVGNHPNALVDALIVVWVVPRRVLVTAKATIFRNPVAARVLSWCGVLPLRRSSDEASRAGAATPDSSRNVDTFRAVNDALGTGGVILIFPEGKSHEEPSLAPLKTGAARMALHARDTGAAPGLAIVPIGLTFERKDAPRSRVLVRVGEPLAMDEWRAPGGGGAGGGGGGGRRGGGADCRHRRAPARADAQLLQRRRCVASRRAGQRHLGAVHGAGEDRPGRPPVERGRRRRETGGCAGRPAGYCDTGAA
ncbi:MAG: lysophospholipid acyltransferase family protein [Gemmatimonadaceae bacterium]